MRRSKGDGGASGTNREEASIVDLGDGLDRDGVSLGEQRGVHLAKLLGITRHNLDRVINSQEHRELFLRIDLLSQTTKQKERRQTDRMSGILIDDQQKSGRKKEEEANLEGGFADVVVAVEDLGGSKEERELGGVSGRSLEESMKGDLGIDLVLDGGLQVDDRDGDLVVFVL